MCNLAAEHLRHRRVDQCVRRNNLKKSKADFTVGEIYFSNISKGAAFRLQGQSQTYPEEERSCLSKYGKNILP